ncbi:hypothetical protein Dimus_019572 [Dionaea muscipula]
MQKRIVPNITLDVLRKGCLNYRRPIDGERHIYVGDGKSVEVEAIGSCSSEVPQKVSPRAARPLKLNPPEFSTTSPGLGKGTPKDRSPKVPDRRSPRSPVCEKKRPSKVSELESQISQLEVDLKKVEDQLVTSVSSKKDAQDNAEELKKELVAVSSKLDESQKQLSELLANKEAQVVELRSISEEKDQAWKSQLEAAQKQHSVDSTAFASALDEIEKLKLQLEMVVAESEDAQSKSRESSDAELKSLREKLAETVTLVEITRNELVSCKESEARAQEVAQETLLQLESTKETVNALRLDSIKAAEAYNSISSELDLSRAHVSSLEGLVKKLKSDPALENGDDNKISDEGAIGKQDVLEAKHLEIKLIALKSEVGHLKSAVEATEIRYHEEQVRNSAQIRNAQELVEQIKSSSSVREAELEEELKKAKADTEELRENVIMDRGTQLQQEEISEENEVLNMKLDKSISHAEKDHELEKELRKLREDVAELKANLMDKETELQNILEENEMLKTEAAKRKVPNNSRNHDSVAAEVDDASRSTEQQEALAKISQVMEEADKSNKKAARVSVQLEAAQAVNAEMESELRRLKVQTDQWRKAAEAAASMLSAGNNGNFLERTGARDSNFIPIPGRISTSPDLDIDYDDDSPKKKNGNVLKKIGVLWKKPQK